MPIYEYECAKCGVFEVTQRITEPSLKRCPKCKGKVERLLSRTSFVLKGSGWYASDYASSSTPKSDSGTTESPTNGAAAASFGSTDSSANSTASDSSAKDSSTKPAGKSKSSKPAAKPTD